MSFTEAEKKKWLEEKRASEQGLRVVVGAADENAATRLLHDLAAV